MYQNKKFAKVSDRFSFLFFILFIILYLQTSELVEMTGAKINTKIQFHRIMVFLLTADIRLHRIIRAFIPSTNLYILLGKEFGA